MHVVTADYHDFSVSRRVIAQGGSDRGRMETRGEGVGVCSFISLSALLASIITYREGVPLWTAELNDLTVPESAEARE